MSRRGRGASISLGAKVTLTSREGHPKGGRMAWPGVASLSPHLPADPLTLDAASAHPDLIISQDLKTVTLKPVSQRVCAGHTDPERFYPFRCVLGLPGLCSGCQTWEAELQGPEGGGCVVGVASELVPRKGMLQIEPLSGFWALRIAGSECQALTETGTREDLSVCLRKVGVHVNHECGKVVFYDATTSNHLYTFHASFPGQIFPFFRLLFPGTQITLSP